MIDFLGFLPVETRNSCLSEASSVTTFKLRPCLRFQVCGWGCVRKWKWYGWFVSWHGSIFLSLYFYIFKVRHGGSVTKLDHYYYHICHKKTLKMLRPQPTALLISIRFLSTESEQLIWKVEGLPSDDLSMENAMVILQVGLLSSRCAEMVFYYMTHADCWKNW